MHRFIGQETFCGKSFAHTPFHILVIPPFKRSLAVSLPCSPPPTFLDHFFQKFQIKTNPHPSRTSPSRIVKVSRPQQPIYLGQHLGWKTVHRGEFYWCYLFQYPTPAFASQAQRKVSVERDIFK